MFACFDAFGWSRRGLKVFVNDVRHYNGLLYCVAAISKLAGLLIIWTTKRLKWL